MNEEMFSKVEEVADWFGENGYEILAESIRYAAEEERVREIQNG